MCRCPCLVHQRPHPLDRTFQPTKNCFTYKEVANIEFNDGRYTRHGSDRIECQPMTCMAFDTQRFRVRRRPFNPSELAVSLSAPGFAESARM